MTNAAERLPHLFVIGAYKCGTTMLQHFLEDHPDIFVPTVKEPNFWAFDGLDDHELRSEPSARWSIRDPRAYRALFDDARPDQVIAEVSPEYLKSRHALERLAAVADERSHFVAILRDPADRAYSDYLMYRRDGVEPLEDFGAALDDQRRRLEEGLAIGHYVDTGRYATQLAPWIETFGHERVHIVLYGALGARPDQVARTLYEIAGVDPGVTPSGTDAVNVSGIATGRLVRLGYGLRNRLAPLGRHLPAVVKRRIDRSLQAGLVRPPIEPGIRSRLVEEFRPEIERLQTMIGRPLDDWLDHRADDRPVATADDPH